jgi:hypothetical protein
MALGTGANRFPDPPSVFIHSEIPLSGNNNYEDDYYETSDFDISNFEEEYVEESGSPSNRIRSDSTKKKPPQKKKKRLEDWLEEKRLRDELKDENLDS